jgi:hypothetical protein
LRILRAKKLAMKKEKEEAARMKKAQTDWTETVPLPTLNYET